MAHFQNSTRLHPKCPTAWSKTAHINCLHFVSILAWFVGRFSPWTNLDVAVGRFDVLKINGLFWSRPFRFIGHFDIETPNRYCRQEVWFVCYKRQIQTAAGDFGQWTRVLSLLKTVWDCEIIHYHILLLAWVSLHRRSIQVGLVV